MEKLLSILLVLFIVVGALTACGGVTPSDRLYRAFTRSEEAAITEAVGEKIPFLPNDDYYFDVTEDGILFSTVGNTEEELSDSIVDDNGEELGYIFVVNSLDGEGASITFTKV